MFDPGTFILLFLAFLTQRGIGPVVGVCIRARYVLGILLCAGVLLGRVGAQPWYPNSLIIGLLLGNLFCFLVFLHFYGRARSSCLRWAAHLALATFWNLQVYFLAPNIFVEPDGAAQLWFLDLLNKGVLTFCIPILDSLGLGNGSGFVFAYFAEPFLFFSRQLIPIHLVANYALIGLLYRLVQPHIRECKSPEPICPDRIHPAFALLPIGLWIGSSFILDWLYLGLLAQGIVGLYAAYGIARLAEWLVFRLPRGWKGPLLGICLGLLLLHPNAFTVLAICTAVMSGLHLERWLRSIPERCAPRSMERWLNPVRRHLLLTVSLGIAFPMLLLSPFSFRPYYERPVEPNTEAPTVKTTTTFDAVANRVHLPKENAEPGHASPVHVVKIGPKQRFEIDRYEFPNQRQVLPTTGLSPEQAEGSCRSTGKSLCTIEQWYQACSLGGRFPTLGSWTRSRSSADADSNNLSGDKVHRPHKKPRCNLADRGEFTRLGAWLSWVAKTILSTFQGGSGSNLNPWTRKNAPMNLLDSKGLASAPSLAPAGAFSTCKNQLGLFDMIGNAYEWVRLPGHDGMWGLAGSYYRYSDTVTNRCDMHLYVHRSQVSIIDLDGIGFRCCR